ncbi:hypothetical protein ACAW74_18650 [Fibrella sp. WM1]|uniref:hypothetical protein n=1 Tax=Fibrella musci TaxID=3242485 RepID=UPI00351FA1F9
MRFVGCLLLFVSALMATAQTRFTVATIRSSQRDPNTPNTWIVDAMIKATAGPVSAAQRAYEFALPGGDKAYVDVELFDELKAGQTAQAILKSYNGEPKAGQALSQRGSSPVKAPANRTFEGVISQAFMGDGKDVYNVFLKQFSGYLLPGDVLQATGPAGQRCATTVVSLDRRQPAAVDMLTPTMTDVSLSVKTAGCVLNEAYKLALSGAKTMTAEPPVAKAAGSGTFRGKRVLTPVNAQLNVGGVVMTVNTIAKYTPTPGPFVKVDPSLDYYVLDVSVENPTSQPVDVGELTLRLNFFDAQGNSADDFSRLFKADGKQANEPSRQADAIDKQVFGGTGTLRFAPIQIAYSQDLPGYSQATYDQLWGKIGPGQTVRCEAIKVIGVPKSHRPTSVGTWQGSRRQLVTAPITLTK